MPDLTEKSPPPSALTPTPPPVTPSSAGPAEPPSGRSVPPGAAPSGGSSPPPKKPAVIPPQATPPRPPDPPRATPFTPPPPPPPPPSRSRTGLWLGALGFLLLLGVAVWQWTELQDLREQIAGLSQKPGPSVDAAGLEARLAALEQRPAAVVPPPVDLAPLDARLSALEQRPVATAPPPVDLAPLETRLGAVEEKPPVDLAPTEKRLEALEQKPPVDLTPLDKRLAALEQKPPVDLAPLEQRLTAVENRPPPPPFDPSPLRSRLSALGEQIGVLSQKLATTQERSVQVGDRAERTQKLEAAALALSSGRPLGSLDAAPPVLQRFATVAPPTEASLRLSFEASAKAAETASDAAADRADMVDRAWQRVQTLVTVRRGDQVLVGAPAAVVLAQSRQHLVAGDLAGAVKALDGLDDAAAKAMADWRAEAQALLEARAALAGLVSGGSATP